MQPPSSYWSHGLRPSHVAVVLDQPNMGPEWKSWLTFELALRKVVLGTDEVISDEDGFIAFFRFMELEEVQEILRAAHVEISALQCPWGGAVRGAIAWDGNCWDVMHRLVPRLLWRSRGPVLRTEDGAYREPLRKVTFSLMELTSKHGFDDGDAFLSHDPDYLEYACREATAALAAGGLEAGVGSIDTHHNPLRIWGPVRRLDQREEVQEWELGKLSMAIWAYDTSFMSDVSFW